MNDSTLERVRLLFNESGKSQTELGRILKVTPQYIWRILNKDDVNPSDRLIDDICEKMQVSKPWLIDGVGPMEKQPDDIFSEAVADMITRDNPFYDLIKGIVETYAELDPGSQQVIDQSCDKLLENLKKKREGETPPQT